jgi:hypothetical protein
MPRLFFPISHAPETSAEMKGFPKSIRIRARVCRRAGNAFGTRQRPAQSISSTLWGHDPRPVYPWGLVPDMLVMPAFELSDPMLFFVLMKAYDAVLNRHRANPTP